MIKQPTLTLQGVQKSEMRTQFAALCYRIKKGKVQVLIITSRRSKRWIVPKGWPIEGKTPAGSVLQEAWEEAGVIGRAGDTCLGIYTYTKSLGEDDLACLALLYPVEVRSLSKIYPEAHERRRRWVSRKEAARLIAEPDLRHLIRDFDPRPKARKS